MCHDERERKKPFPRTTLLRRITAFIPTRSKVGESKRHPSGKEEDETRLVSNRPLQHINSTNESQHTHDHRTHAASPTTPKRHNRGKTASSDKKSKWSAINIGMYGPMQN